MLLRRKLPLKPLYLSESTPAEVVRSGTHLCHLFVEVAKLTPCKGYLLSNALLARCGTYQAHFALNFEELRVDRLALRLLTCIDKAAI